MRRRACEATRVRGEQSEDLLDRRMLCLDQHLQDVAATTLLFAQADFQILDKAIPSVNKLPPIALGAKNPALAYSLAGISRVLPMLGRAPEAIPAQRAVALFESQPGQTDDVHEIEGWLRQRGLSW